MREVAQDLDLAQRSLRVCEVVKGLSDFLDRNFFLRQVVQRRADHAVCAMANRLDQRVARIDVKPRAAHHETVDFSAVGILHGWFGVRMSRLPNSVAFHLALCFNGGRAVGPAHARVSNAAGSRSGRPKLEPQSPMMEEDEFR